MARFLFLALVCCTLAGTPALAQDSIRAGRGLVIAQQWCSSCHKVVDGQPSTSDVAPTFASIAQRPDRESAFLRAWLLDPHQPMPKLELSRSDVDDLVAYIFSLSRSPQR
ncbi:MAG: cytochrome c [Alphaproteobacteria bacterium]|nr:cytochrome c [Alphaproteobacteria bacterium]